MNDESVFAHKLIKIDVKVPSCSNLYVTDNLIKSEAILGRNSEFVLENAEYDDIDERILLTYMLKMKGV